MESGEYQPKRGRPRSVDVSRSDLEQQLLQKIMAQSGRKKRMQSELSKALIHDNRLSRLTKLTKIVYDLDREVRQGINSLTDEHQRRRLSNRLSIWDNVRRSHFNIGIFHCFSICIRWMTWRMKSI